MADDSTQYTDAQLADGTTLRFKGQLAPDEVKQKVSAYRAKQGSQVNGQDPQAYAQSQAAAVPKMAAQQMHGAVSLMGRPEPSQAQEESFNKVAPTLGQIAQPHPLGRSYMVPPGHEGTAKLDEALPIVMSMGSLGEGAQVAPQAMKDIGDVAERIPLLNKIPLAARAGERFQQVAKAANELPVAEQASPHVDAMKAALKEIEAEGEAGGKTPKVISDFVKRIADPEKGPLSYEEARRFYKNAGALTPEEAMTLKPSVKRLVSQFLYQGLGPEIAKTADVAGESDAYGKAMSGYAAGKQLGALGKMAGRAALAGTGLGGAYELYKLLSR